MKRTLFIFALAGLGTLSSGCSIVDGENVEQNGCGLAAADAPFLSSTLTLQYGAREVCDARVTVRQGASEAVVLQPLSPTECHTFTMPGRGTYEVTVERGGYLPVTHEVSLRGASGCLGPENVGLQLEPAAADCDEPAVPSFQVDLRTPGGAPVCDASVVVREGAFERELRPLLNDDGTCSWDGPVERPGTYNVKVTKPGYEPVILPSALVEREPSGCHVVPAKVNAQLAPIVD